MPTIFPCLLPLFYPPPRNINMQFTESIKGELPSPQMGDENRDLKLAQILEAKDAVLNSAHTTSSL